MSKRLILMVVLVVSVLTGTAQVANRSGFFVEAGVGGLVGNTLINDGKSTDVMIKTKAGASYDAMVGYRWAFSRNWALDSRLGIDDPGTMALDIMPGIRYTTNDFIASKSLFFQANVGICFTFDDSDDVAHPTDCASFVMQLQAGVNITNHLYASLYYLGHVMSHRRTDFSGFDNIRDFGTLGLRLGYRF